jgi:integrase
MVQSENYRPARSSNPSYSDNPSLVKIENDDRRLRLRFTYAGKRYALAIGLPDSRVNRLVAQQKAAQIELDIASGNFDFTLSKYKPPRQTSLKSQEITVAELFQQFAEYQSKNKELQPGSICRSQNRNCLGIYDRGDSRL